MFFSLFQNALHFKGTYIGRCSIYGRLLIFKSIDFAQPTKLFFTYTPTGVQIFSISFQIGIKYHTVIAESQVSVFEHNFMKMLH